MPENPLGVTQNAHLAMRLTRIDRPEEIPERWQNTPIAALIGAHNFGQKIEVTGEPHLLVAACIEFRFTPKIPANYAYVIRRASGRLIGSEFSLVYTLARGVRHVALIGHDDCGMTKVTQFKQPMIEALVEQGWDKERATEYVNMHGGRYAIQDEVDSLRLEYFRLKRLFKSVEFAPIFVSLASDKFYIPDWYLEQENQQRDTSKEDRNQVAPEDLLMLP